jgi:uncharacterized protein
MRYISSIVFLALCWTSVTFALPQPGTYVVDSAGVIEDATESNLNGYLQELEQKTGTQMIVLAVDTTEGIPIEQYAIGKAMSWGLGQKGKDNGLLMVVAVKDRKYRIEVGYGLEPVIPDSLAGTIARQYMVPRFKANDYSGGIYLASLALIETIAKAENVTLTGMPKVSQQYQGKTRSSGLGSILFFILLALMFSRPGSRGFMNMLFLSMLLGNSWGGRGSSSGGFGSFGGGGFGGFGGGGGGSFGGGGISGSW